MRAIPDSLDPAVVTEIDARLDGLTATEQVRIPWAIESGSRAWGFPSPDSDYDCRFFYLRGEDDYLGLWPPRDVLETPLDKIFDVNGWDLAKALRLLVAGNATVTEWLGSPIVYRGDREFHDRFTEVADAVVRPDRLRRHYLHLGLRQISNFETGQVRLKRLFYALRPALSLEWLRRHGTVPPMDLPALLAGCPPPSELGEVIDELLERKARTHELGAGPVPGTVDAYLRRELALAEAVPGVDGPSGGAPSGPEMAERVDDFFRWAVRNVSG